MQLHIGKPKASLKSPEAGLPKWLVLADFCRNTPIFAENAAFSHFRLRQFALRGHAQGEFWFLQGRNFGLLVFMSRFSPGVSRCRAEIGVFSWEVAAFLWAEEKRRWEIAFGGWSEGARPWEVFVGRWAAAVC